MEQENSKKKVFTALSIVLAILGLLTAVVVVAGYLYKKAKKIIGDFNADLTTEELGANTLSEDASPECTEGVNCVFDFEKEND